MDPYLTTLAVGGVGLGAMALSGFAAHGHGAATTRAGQAGHTGHAGQAGQAGHAPGGSHGAGHVGAHGHAPVRDQGLHLPGARRSLTALLSPRLLFSVCLGLGTTGVVLGRVLGGPVLFAVTLAGGIAFDRLLVTPLWNFAFRFESTPALTLESAVSSEATAASTFDADGHGLVAVELDGQVVQVLGTLQEGHRALGVQVRAGAKLRVEDVDVARNRCTVSLL